MFNKLSNYLESIRPEIGKRKELAALAKLRVSYSDEELLDTLNFVNSFGCPPYGKKQPYIFVYLRSNPHLLEAVRFEKNRNLADENVMIEPHIVSLHPDLEL